MEKFRSSKKVYSKMSNFNFCSICYYRPETTFTDFRNGHITNFHNFGCAPILQNSFLSQNRDFMPVSKKIFVKKKRKNFFKTKIFNVCFFKNICSNVLSNKYLFLYVLEEKMCRSIAKYRALYLS